MEACLGRRRSSSEQLGPGVGEGEDRISALPDDLLLLVLARLPCAGAAARTGVLSRRWRGLWPRLRRIVLRGVPFHCLEPALACVSRPPPTVSLLDIRLQEPRGRVPTEQMADNARLISSLLRAAALLDPEEFFLVIPGGIVHADLGFGFDLPCFHRATSIVLDLRSAVGRLPAGVELPALETLSMSRCDADFNDVISRCPRLRTLRLNYVGTPMGVLSVNSPLLQELVVSGIWIRHVNIVAPVLTQLTISLLTNEEFSISILAPMVEKVSWDCDFSNQPAFGLWRLGQLSLQVAERQGQPPWLKIHAFISSFHGEEANLTQNIEKHLVADFSVLELNLKTKGHVYGALVSHVLEINRIRCAIQRLKIDIQRSLMEEYCLANCPCEPTDLKSQTVSLTALEEVEISGFGGKDHDFDFLKWILRCAPLLKRMTMRLSRDASASEYGCTKVYTIFKAYSSVQCYVYLTSGLMHGSRNCPSK